MEKYIYLKDSDEWAFGHLAEKLSRYLQCPITNTPVGKCYVLSEPEIPIDSYIPLNCINISSDKRLMESCFSNYNVARPATYILENEDEISKVLASGDEYLLKYPTSCGANGHYMVSLPFKSKKGWPKPYLLQKFIRVRAPKVYRLYCVSGLAVGSNVRKFDGDTDKILVAHAQGAKYSFDESVDALGIKMGLQAINSVGLGKSFGVVDLVKDIHGNWLVLEIGTDGIYNIVDRDYSNEQFDALLHSKIAESFHVWSGK